MTMTPRHLLQYLALFAALIALPVPAAARPAALVSMAGPIGLAAGQTSRVNVWITSGFTGPVGAGPCSVDIVFTDGDGVTLKQTTLTVAPGKIASVDLAYTDLPAAPLRGEIDPCWRVPTGTCPRFGKGMAGSVEIFDARTGLTQVVLLPTKP